MHGIDSDNGASQRKRAKQSLHCRDFIGLFVAVEMRQHQGRVRCKGAENMRSLAVAEIVEAQTQRLTVHSDVPLAVRSGPLVKDGGMAPEYPFDRSSVQLSEDITDCGVGWCVPPLQTKKFLQTSEMNINETVDTPVRIGARQHCQDGKQNDVRQAILLTFGSSRVLDFGQ